MKLITGGAFQGKLAYAKQRYQVADGWIDGETCAQDAVRSCRGIYHFHAYVRRMLVENQEEYGVLCAQETDSADCCVQTDSQKDLGAQRAWELDAEQRAQAFVDWLYRENPDILVVMDELGCGVVPMEPTDREYRETVGRVGVCLARRSEEVVRVVCGIGTVLFRDKQQRSHEDKQFFPLFVDLSETAILVVGAGTIAARRIRTLLDFAGDITVCAPQVCTEIRTFAEKGSIVLLEQPFSEGMLEGRELVLAATDDRELNRCIGECCRRRGIPVNVCSEKEACDFYFPSVLRKDGVVIGLNASGRDHGLVKRTRQELEEYLKK